MDVMLGHPEQISVHLFQGPVSFLPNAEREIVDHCRG